jgi:hypothetical protein
VIFYYPACLKFDTFSQEGRKEGRKGGRERIKGRRKKGWS